MDVNSRIRAARIAAGFRSAQDAARRFGWTPTTYASHENGQTKTPPLEAIEAYAAAYRVTPEHLAFGVEKPARKIAPVVGVVGAREKVNIILQDEGAIDWVESPETDLFAVITKGASMEPAYREGDVLFFAAPKSRTAAIGRDCIVVTDRDRAYVKILKPGSRPGLFDLESYNAREPIKDAAIRWAAPVLWVKRHW